MCTFSTKSHETDNSVVSFCPKSLEMNKGWKRKGFVFNMAIVFMPPCGQSTQWIFVIYAAAAQNVKFLAILSFDYSDGDYTVYSRSLQFYTFWNFNRNQTESDTFWQKISCYFLQNVGFFVHSH
jgi:hypothetical protein